MFKIYAKRKALLPEHLQYIYHLLLNIVSSASEIWVWELSAPKADETFLKPSLNKFSLWWELQVAGVSVTAVPTLVLICHNTNVLLEKNLCLHDFRAPVLMIQSRET